MTIDCGRIPSGPVPWVRFRVTGGPPPIIVIYCDICQAREELFGGHDQAVAFADTHRPCGRND